ncbi:Crp/Fnr family transcriptional regulator [Euzebyella marina]|uniref:Crp/Fnr family transcriptional regulator n=1 Tax=Euzebyella marina TaxID=1761453 RepID=A0A3G2L7E4_9FLAO|nr:Crp/Fnr family transcriptional regulator [Euzebyella marina]AYN68175.1 Crp/Fnr family transcriptional regulator [Euzebyella marina]
MQPSVDISFLAQVYNHPLLSRNDIVKLSGIHTREFIKKGTFVLEKGSVPQEYYILESGLLRSFVHDYNGKDITVNFFTEGELIIEVASLFQRIPSSENIEALTNCTVYKVDFEEFQQLFHEMEGFREWGRAWMSKSLFDFKQRSTSMIVDSAKERYEHLMKHRPSVSQKAPLKHIASYLGITDSSLSRIRKAK